MSAPPRGSRLAVLVGLTGLVSLVVAGCSPSGGSAGSRSAPDDAAATATSVEEAAVTSVAPATPAPTAGAAPTTGAAPTAGAAPPRPLWQHEADVLSRPARVDGTVVAYVGGGDGRGVRLVGLDADDGTESWSVAVDVTDVASLGTPAVLDGTVLTLSADAGPGVRVVAVDPVDGSEVARTSEAFTAYRLPSQCGLQEGTACVTGFRAGETVQDYATWQVLVEGDVLTLAPPPPPSETGVRAEDLTVRTTFGTPEEPAVFVAERGGDVVWEVPTAQLGLDIAGREGRAGSVGTQAGVYVHDVVYVDATASVREEVSVPLDEHLLLALDAETGQKLWSRTGTVKCSGNAEVEDRFVTCSGTGAVVLAPWPGGASFEAEDVVMRGVERATGTVLWEHEITAEDWTALDALPGPVGAGQVLVQIHGRPQLLDLRTGEALADDTVPPGGYICSDQREWGRTGEQADGDERRTDWLAFACSIDGETAPAATRETVERVADEAGDLLLVTAPGSISAYPSDG